MSTVGVPATIRTQRLLLQRWQPAHASLLSNALEPNEQYLLPWIPRQVALAAPVPELSARLGNFSTDFDEGRGWRYGIFSPDAAMVYGEVSLFPRADAGRVLFPDADRCEIGYWLREDVTGRGYATEAANAMVELASTMPQVRHVEIRCDTLNVRSAAIPRRLGFHLAMLVSRQTDGGEDMIWVFSLEEQALPA